MSHVSKVDVSFTDLNEIKEACARIGAEFLEGQTTHRWFGNWVGDYNTADAAYKHGVKPEDYGTCLHAIGVPGSKTAYEAGVIRNQNGTYGIIYDNWCGGKGLEKVIGQNADTLKQAYAVVVAKKQVQRKGFRVVEVTKDDGRIQLLATK
jgi:hypothetical protein